MANKRQQILDAIEARIKTVNGIAPYNLNLSKTTFVWKGAQFVEGEIPGVNIQDLSENLDQELFGGGQNQWYRRLNIEITLICNGSLSDKDVRKGISDIQRAINGVNGAGLTWNGLAIDTKWEETRIEKDENEMKIMSATIAINVIYSTTQWSES